MSNCHWLILHGKQASHADLRRAIMARREQGDDIAVRVTWEDGDVARLVQEGIDAGASSFIAAGGDGTVRDLADALMTSGQSNLKLAILPLGTANDFATAAAIPERMSDALALLDQAPTPCDTIEINGRFFLNMATGGFGTEVTTQTSEELKRLLGGAAYLLTGISKFTEIEAASGRFEGENFDWEGNFLAAGLGNGRQAGGGQPLCPDAWINDGLLDVAILPANMDLLAGVKELFDSDARQDPDQQGLFVRARVKHLEVTTPSPMHFNLDGEPLEGTHFKIKVHPNGLSLYLPDQCPLLR